MSTRISELRPLIAWVWTASVILGGIAVAAVGSYRDSLDPEHIVSFLLAFLYAVLGLLIAQRQPGNRVAWILLLVSTLAILNGAADLRLDDGPLPGSTWDALAIIWSNTGYFVVFVIPLLLLLYIFPTGQFLSRGWSWAGWVAGVATATLLFVNGFASEVGLNGASAIRNPIGFHNLSGSDDEGAVALVVGVCLIALILGGPPAIVVRFRRSSAIVRTQIKFAVFGMFLIPIAFVSGTFVEDGRLSTALYIAALAVAPLTIAIAIVRHNLFDIDVIISRSLTFGVLAAFIGAVYVVIVVGIGELIGSGDESSFALSVAATAVVAIAFQPVRSRVEHWANRLVYGNRATPYEVLAQFSRRATVDSNEAVLAGIPRLIVDGTGASEATVWVRSGSGFRTASVWPATQTSRRFSASGEFRDPDADVSLPVFHDEDLLGGISLVTARGMTISPPEQDLLANLADGLGLTLRNSQLTAALQRQVKDLQRSRDRVVSAADEARQSLERDLDSGPQQRLVAAKVKLGPIRKLAEQAGAIRTAQVLADIEAQTGDAIQAVRDFAAGIYPPLLGAEGLAIALGQQARKAALPVDLETDGVGRYPRDVEAAVYFTILETLQNTAKYAKASQAVVKLTEHNEDLLFEVRDNGQGFDLATFSRGAGLNSIADRIDTVAGTWAISSTPGEGTVVSGSVPVRDHTPATVGTTLA